MKVPYTVTRLPLDDIRPSPTNPRKSFPDDSLAELAASIREKGVLQDILVRPVAAAGKKPSFDGRKWQHVDHFELIAGERRLRAAKLAGLSDIGAKVLEMSDEDVLAIQLVENDQREDVKPTEQAAAYQRLVDAVGLAEAAKRIGKGESVVRGICRIAKAPPSLAEAVDKGLVSRSVAELVCRVPGDASRERAAYCVLTGLTYPPSDSLWNSVDDHRPNMELSGGPLTYRETKELIAKHFTRELKQATFSRTALYLIPDCAPDRNDYLPKCDSCPRRAGNDPEAKAEGVRADVCLDPECFEQKTLAHRQAEIERFAKKHKMDIESVPTVEMNGFIPAGWVETSAKVLETELARDGDGYTNWKRKPKPDVTVLELLTDPDGIPTIQPGTCRLHLAIDAKGKPHTLVKAADLRKNLVRVGIIEKPKPAPKAKPTANGKPASTPSTDGPYLLYRLKLNPDVLPTVEFDAHEDETANSLREKAACAFMDWFDSIDWSDSPICPRPFVDYERVPAGEEAELRPRSCRVCGCTDANCAQCVEKTGQPCSWVGADLCSACVPTSYTYDDLIRHSLHCQENSESLWKAMVEQGATDSEIKAALATVWGLGAGSSGPAREGRPRYEYRYKGGTKPSLECTLGDDDEGPLKLKGVPLVSRVRVVLGIPHPDEVQASAPAGPIVCAPVGAGRLADIPGITKEDAACLAAVGITTLGGLEQRLDALRADRRRQNATIYDVLRQYPGAFSGSDATRIGDTITDHLNTITDHLNVAKAVGGAVPDITDEYAAMMRETAEAMKPAKGKRKAVVK